MCVATVLTGMTELQEKLCLFSGDIEIANLRRATNSNCMLSYTDDISMEYGFKGQW